MKEAFIKFFAVSFEDKSMFFEAVFSLAAARLSIRGVPFADVAPRFGRQMAVTPFADVSGKKAAVFAVRRAVKRASRYVPWQATCLAEAAAVDRMLRRRGLCGTLYLGMARQDGALKFHAWYRCGSVVVCGGKIRREFTEVSSFANCPPDNTNSDFDGNSMPARPQRTR